jgi:flagellar basal body-associated protein FliL
MVQNKNMGLSKIRIAIKVAVVVLTCVMGSLLFYYSQKLLTDLISIADENPSLAIPGFVGWGAWIALFCSLPLMAISLIVWFAFRKFRMVSVVILIIMIAVFISGAFACEWFNKYLEKNAAVSSLGNAQNPNFAEITLRELKANLSAKTGGICIVYIGRIDCRECDGFEENITPYLEKNAFALKTYYTNSDRDGPRAKTMYKLLEKYDVISVPTIIVADNAKTIKIIDNPAEHISEIERYIDLEFAQS